MDPPYGGSVVRTALKTSNKPWQRGHANVALSLATTYLCFMCVCSSKCGCRSGSWSAGHEGKGNKTPPKNRKTKPQRPSDRLSCGESWVGSKPWCSWGTPTPHTSIFYLVALVGWCTWEATPVGILLTILLLHNIVVFEFYVASCTLGTTYCVRTGHAENGHPLHKRTFYG